MKEHAPKLLRAFLWFIAAFHLVTGLALNVSAEFAKTMAGLYGATVDWTLQFNYILKPLGAFMVALGIMAAAAALKPIRYRAVVYGFAVLFLIRAGQRLLFQDDIGAAFGIGSGRNMINAAFFAAMGLALLSLYRLVEKQPGAKIEG